MFSGRRGTRLILSGPGLGMLLSWASLAAVEPTGASQASLASTYGDLPSTFEANVGQTGAAVRFLSRGQGYTLFLTPAEAVLSLSRPQHAAAVVRLQLAGGKRAPRVVGLEPQATTSHYLIGNDPARWHTGVPHYARVRYEGVYPGVDLVYHGSRRRLEYDLVIAPHSDPGRIRLRFRGAGAISIGPAGELILQTANGDLVQPAPEVYQEAEGRRRRVEGRYLLLAPGLEVGGGDASAPREVGFGLGRYDPALPLIIDPVLVYSTVLGGSGGDGALGVAVDAAGHAYVTGSTSSTVFPGVTGSSLQPANAGGSGDAFVTKLDPTGTAIVYSTFLGGSGADSGSAIAVDAAGNAYVTGSTSSTVFPGVTGSSLQPANAGGQDAFVTKLDPAGTAIVYSTFLGGSGLEQSRGIGLDGAGSAYVTGSTTSTTFPGVGGGSLQAANGGGQDAFVTKLDPAGTAIFYSTFLGGSGTDTPGGALGSGLAVDGGGNAYVTGSTTSPAFPGVGGGSLQPAHGGGGTDAFVTKIDAAGTAIVYSTFLGGGGPDEGGGLAVDGAGSAYVTGDTESTTFPGVGGGSLQPANAGGSLPGDAFVTKLDPSGTAIVYSTFLGGSGNDGGSGIAVDTTGNAYVTGGTTSTTFPGVNAGSLQPAHGGGITDAFLTKLDPTGTAILYSTFLGGGTFDEARAIAVDGAGSAYVAGFSLVFPGGPSDGFVMKIGNAAFDPAIPTLDPRGLILLVLLLATLGVLAVNRRAGGRRRG